MSETVKSTVTAVGIDIGKNSFHVVGEDRRGTIVLRRRWSRAPKGPQEISLISIAILTEESPVRVISGCACRWQKGDGEFLSPRACEGQCLRWIAVSRGPVENIAMEKDHG
jgi:hypothetical protein